MIRAEKGGRLGALDGLRFVLCVWVVFGHGFAGHAMASFAHRLSHQAVRVFFVLSGFLITSLLSREERTNGAFDLRSFYARRALRILPVYGVAVVLALALLALLGDAYAMAFGSAMKELRLGPLAGTHALFVSNLFSQPAPSTLDVLWSIGVEEQFYLVFPLLLRLLPTPALRGALVVVSLVCGAALRLRFGVEQPTMAYRHTLTNADHLLVGAALALFRWPEPEARGATVLEGIALLAPVALCAWSPSSAAGVAIDGLVSCASSALLVAVLASGRGWCSAALARPLPRWLGDRSYAAYVFHMYALVAAWAIAKSFVLWAGSADAVVAPLRTVLAVPFAFAIAAVVRVAFEGRILALKARYAPKPSRASAT